MRRRDVDDAMEADAIEWAYRDYGLTPFDDVGFAALDDLDQQAITQRTGFVHGKPWPAGIMRALADIGIAAARPADAEPKADAGADD